MLSSPHLSAPPYFCASKSFEHFIIIINHFSIHSTVDLILADVLGYVKTMFSLSSKIFTRFRLSNEYFHVLEFVFLV